MSGYDDPFWSESIADDSPLERAREDADLREWEDEVAQDRVRRDDPCRRLSVAHRPAQEREAA